LKNRAGIFSRWTTVQLVFISLMVAADISIGFIVKPVLGAIGIDQLIRLDLILPTAFHILVRLLIDRFGTILLYEFVWGIIAMLTMPTSYASLPGPAKLIPALINGLILDSLLQFFKNRPALRVTIAAVVGGCVSMAALMTVRVAFGFPWSKVVKILLGVQMGTGLLVNAAGAMLGLKIWQTLKDTYPARIISE
jgi:hypothetical protein